MRRLHREQRTALPMVVHCYRCRCPVDSKYDWDILCPICHAAAKAAMKNPGIPCGGQSSLNEDQGPPAMEQKGLFSGSGKTAGGGRRVVKKSEPLGG